MSSYPDFETAEGATKEADRMTEHKVGTREEWLEAREDLLEREKELTRLSDELARQGLELSVGLRTGERLQPRLRPVHRGAATNRQRVQLRLPTQSRPRPPARGAAWPELLRARGRRRPPRVLVLRPGYGRAELHLAAA